MAEDALVTVRQAATEEAARAVAVVLVERGIGATVVRLPDPPGAAGPAAEPFAVQVLPGDLARAEVLLAEAPDPDPGSSADQPSTAGGDDAVGAGGGPRSTVTTGDPVTPAAAPPAPGRDLQAGPAATSGAAPDAPVPPEVVAAIRASTPAADLDAQPPVVEKEPTPWKRLLLLWAAAMILIPLAAFALTYLVLSR